MAFRLNSNNLFDYLAEHGLCDRSESSLNKIEPLAAKNFNLLVTFLDRQKLLVKQERHDREGKAAGEFLFEWQIQELLQRFPELAHLSPFLPEMQHFDRDNSIIIFSYLDNYRDVMDFYTPGNYFPCEVATAIGTLLATIHRETFKHQKYQDFFSQNSNNLRADLITHLIRSLERISPEVFGSVPTDGLKFFALYQRYDSLGQALAELSAAFQPCCLTHNDLKLNNILLHNNWQQLVSPVKLSEPSGQSVVRLIDWERSNWGDPAFDLGSIIASYLQMWLSSLIVSKAITIEDSLRLATTPLEQIQPSIAALMNAYLDCFPEILDHSPNFVKRVVEFSGLGLIQTIQSVIQYQKSFGNSGICMLQVAKTLLCRPEQSIPNVFGMTVEELTRRATPISKS